MNTNWNELQVLVLCLFGKKIYSEIIIIIHFIAFYLFILLRPRPLHFFFIWFFFCLYFLFIYIVGLTYNAGQKVLLVHPYKKIYFFTDCNLLIIHIYTLPLSMRKSWKREVKEMFWFSSSFIMYFLKALKNVWIYLKVGFFSKNKLKSNW